MGDEAAQYQEIPLPLLRLDSLNPRLPEGLESAGQDELRAAILENYDPLDIARSIAEHGYFLSEPLIVVADGDVYTVVEGNRRLVALQVLSDTSLAAGTDELAEWESLAEESTVPERIPVVLAVSRDAVVPILGYRHISGIEPWDPYAKARYVAGLIDQGQSFEDVARVVGETWNNVVTLYRNYLILKQARDQFGLDTSGALNYFGVFTRALSTRLREYIDAPLANQVEPGVPPLASGSAERLEQVLSWLFGDSSNPAVVSDSRDVTKLGQVAISEDGRPVLESTRDLEVAYEAAGGYFERLLQRLTKARNLLTAAGADYPQYSDDDQVKLLMEECQAALDVLRTLNVEA